MGSSAEAIFFKRTEQIKFNWKGSRTHEEMRPGQEWGVKIVSVEVNLVVSDCLQSSFYELCSVPVKLSRLPKLDQ